MRLALLPLDDRPVSTSLPAEVLAVAGVEVRAPGPGLRPHLRRAPEPARLAAWLADARAETDAAVVSLDALGSGSLIASRTDDRTVGEVLRAWDAAAAPGGAVHAAVVVPRAPDSADAMEEPGYWDPHGPALHALSAELAGGAAVGAAARAVAPAVPDDVVRDWLGRRMRRHALALAALDLLRHGRLATLVVGVDDAAPRSLSAVAQQDLQRWVDRLGLHADALVHPGADETGAVLAARALVRFADHPTPTVAVACAADGGLERPAPYETGPVALTVERQLRASGARVVAAGEPSDAVLVVHGPATTEHPGDWAVAPPRRTDEAAAGETARLAARLLGEGRAVAVADVAHPNGADPALAAALGEAGLWTALDGYAAWNTAGNTVGTVAAQLVATAVARATGTLDAAAHRRMLARRVVEDLGWMSLVRAQARAELGSDPTRHDVVQLDAVRRATWEARLTDVLAGTPGLADLRVRAGSLSLPWDRTFEIDLEVEDA